LRPEATFVSRTLLLVLLFHASSVFSQPFVSSSDASNVETFDEDFLVVWGAMVEVLAAQSWPIDILDKDSGVITSDWVVVAARDRDFADCGEAQSDTFHVQHMRLSASVHEVATGTRLRISSSYESNVGTECLSAGVLESSLIAAVTGLIAGDARAAQIHADSIAAAELAEIPVGDIAFSAGGTDPLGSFGLFAGSGPAFSVRSSLNNETVPNLQVWADLALSIFGTEARAVDVPLGPGVIAFATEESEKLVVSLHLGPQIGSASRIAFLRPRAGVGPGFYLFVETVRTTLAGESEPFDVSTTVNGRFGWRWYGGVDLFFTPRMGMAVDYTYDQAWNFQSARYQSVSIGFVIANRAWK
jgi:hypothetical protein